MQKLCRCTVLVLFLFSIPVIAQMRGSSADESELFGRVIGLTDKTPCSVELNIAGATLPSERSICDSDGTFQFNRLERGVYKLVVNVGVDQYSEEVRVTSPREDVEVRLPSREQTHGNAVSMVELQVPNKAKEELQKANEALVKGELNKADQHATEALEIAPRYARAMTLRAILMIAKQDFSTALRFANSAAAIDPMLPITQFVRASVYNSLGNPDQAQVAAEQGLRLDASWQGHFELARALMEKKDFKQALMEINRAAIKAPAQIADLFLMRASVLLHLKDVNGARENLNEFSKLRPGDARAEQLQSVINGTGNQH
jgi:tetratricopeptide (TPR) repeat protein